MRNLWTDVAVALRGTWSVPLHLAIVIATDGDVAWVDAEPWTLEAITAYLPRRGPWVTTSAVIKLLELDDVPHLHEIRDLLWARMASPGDVVLLDRLVMLSDVLQHHEHISGVSGRAVRDAGAMITLLAHSDVKPWIKRWKVGAAIENTLRTVGDRKDGGTARLWTWLRGFGPPDLAELIEGASTMRPSSA